MSQPKLNMSEMVWNPADPDGRRDWVWLRNPVHLEEVAESDKSSSKKEKRDWSLVRRPDSPPDIIITPPEDCEEGVIIDKPLKPVLDPESAVENEQYGGYAADCETSELGPFEVLRNEPDTGVSSKIEGANKLPRKLIPYSGAREATNKIISAGMDSWEFKWVTKGDIPKVHQVKDSAANPDSPHQIAAERDPRFKKLHNVRSLSERAVTRASAEGRGRRRMRSQRPFVTDPGWQGTAQQDESSREEPTDGMGGEGDEVCKKQEPPISPSMTEGLFFFGEHTPRKTKGLWISRR